MDEGDESKDKDLGEKHPPAILTKPKEATPPSSDFMDYAPQPMVQVPLCSCPLVSQPIARYARVWK